MLATGPSSTPPAIPTTSKVSAHASPQPTPSADPLSTAVARAPSPAPQSSTAAVMSIPPFMPSNSSPPTSTQRSSQHMELQSENTLSPEEMVLIQEYRRLKDASVAVRVVAEPLGGPVHNRDSHVPHQPSTSPLSPRSVSPDTSSTTSDTTWYGA
ncbi:hypothetical protein PAXINDRAFT_17052 [Paxillus involutus ATCC 200175]|uniref:Uncharacterized protein n=1 Tax=Paxillus involutus ATCC 200175 TaxID=664439 RepID=A0A0C9T2D3_PAXIN|nr:hypothetical protein PAXINDRAFT_17052 [Paxillus involutus ATCC 200175]